MNTWNIIDFDYFIKRILKSTEKDIDESLSEENKDIYYKDFFDLQKKNGVRRIYAINHYSNLYVLQKNLTNNFLNNILIADNVYGFVKNCSYVDYLRRHKSFLGNRNYIRLDIKSFFDSISFSLIKDVLEHYIQINEVLTQEKQTQILNYLLEIILYKEKVIQGAVTSPVISNIVFRQLDLRIQKYCNKLDIIYTRYADDLLFSSSNNKVHSKLFLERIAEIIGSKGFTLNYSKIVRGKNEISLNGYVVGKDIRISRKKLIEISRVLFILESLDTIKDESYLVKLNNRIKEETSEKNKFYNNNALINYLAGQRAFIISVVKNTQDLKFKRKTDSLLSRIENNILNIYKT